MARLFAGAMLCWHALLTHAQQPPQGWIEVQVPTSQEQWQCANLSQDSWRVEQTTDGVRIRRHQRASTLRLDLPDGSFSASNRGEFGGVVEWQRAGSSTRSVVLRENPVAFHRLGDAVFVVAGIAHLGVNNGKVLRLARSGDGWTASGSADLGAAPYATTAIGFGKVLVAAADGLREIDLNTMKVQLLFRNDNWGSLIPTSVIRLPSNSVLIGMRRAVSKLTPSGQGYEERWWVPATCPRLVPTGKPGPCVCQAS